MVLPLTVVAVDRDASEDDVVAMSLNGRGQQVGLVSLLATARTL
jgi:hypothetical protein